MSPARSALQWPQDLALFNLALAPGEEGNCHGQIVYSRWTEQNVQALLDFIKFLDPLMNLAVRDVIPAAAPHETDAGQPQSR